MPAVENLACPGREHRLAPPVELDPACAFMSDDARAQIGARHLCRGCCGALDRVVDGAVDRLERKSGAVKIEHRSTPQCAHKNRAPSEGARRWLCAPCR